MSSSSSSSSSSSTSAASRSASSSSSSPSSTMAAASTTSSAIINTSSTSSSSAGPATVSSSTTTTNGFSGVTLRIVLSFSMFALAVIFGIAMCIQRYRRGKADQQLQLEQQRIQQQQLAPPKPAQFASQASGSSSTGRLTPGSGRFEPVARPSMQSAYATPNFPVNNNYTSFQQQQQHPQQFVGAGPPGMSMYDNNNFNNTPSPYASSINMPTTAPAAAASGAPYNNSNIPPSTATLIPRAPSATGNVYPSVYTPPVAATSSSSSTTPSITGGQMQRNLIAPPRTHSNLSSQPSGLDVSAQHPFHRAVTSSSVQSTSSSSTAGYFAPTAGGYAGGYAGAGGSSSSSSGPIVNPVFVSSGEKPLAGPIKWNNEQVLGWLERSGLDAYTLYLFQQKRVDGATLMQLDAVYLRHSIGITSEQTVQQIMEALGRLRGDLQQKPSVSTLPEYTNSSNSNNNNSNNYSQYR